MRDLELHTVLFVEYGFLHWHGVFLTCLFCPVPLLCDFLFDTPFFLKHWRNVFWELDNITPGFHPKVVISPWSQVEAHYFMCEVRICFVCESLCVCLHSKFHLLLYYPVINIIRIFCSSSHSTLIFATLSNSVLSSAPLCFTPLIHTLNCIPGPSSLYSDCLKVVGDGLCWVPPGSSSAPSPLQQVFPCSS